MNSLIKITFLFWTLFLSFEAQAQFHGYLEGLKADLQLEASGFADELESRLHVKKMSFWDRLTSPTATALYSPLFNTIKLKADLIHPNGQIKDAREIRGKRYLTTPVVTIFHEMGHAELDTIIENSSEIEEVSFMALYKNTLKNLYEKNFKGVRPYDLFHEHYAYYKTAVLEFMYNELANIYMENGYNYIDQRCYLTPRLKELLQSGISLEDFVKLRNFSDNDFYQRQIEVRYVFVKGESYNLSNISEWEKTKGLVHKIFWNTLQKYYNFAVNRSQFVERLNNSSSLKAFKKCREKLFYER